MRNEEKGKEGRERGEKWERKLQKDRYARGSEDEAEDGRYGDKDRAEEEKEKGRNRSKSRDTLSEFKAVHCNSVSLLPPRA